MSDGKNRTILWINSGGLKKAFTLEVARRAGYQVILVNRQPDVPERLYEDLILADTYNHLEVIDRIASFQLDHPEISFDGAVTFWEDDIPLLARVCEHFGLIGNSFETSIRTRNKYEMRQCFAQTGLASPQFHLVLSERDVLDSADRIGFPAVMKPAWGADSEFVVLVRNREEARAAWDYLSKNCNESFNPIFKHNAGSFLFEQYVEGVEVSVECYSQYGIPYVLGINEKQPISPPYFVENGDICPARLDERTAAQVRKLAESSLIALGVVASTSHVEMKIGPKGPVLIEVASRMGGDDVYHNIKTVYGHDLVRIALQIATGEHVKIDSREPRGCVVSRYFIPGASGIITNLSGAKGVRQWSNVVDLVLTKDVGDAVLIPPEGFENMGWVAVKGNSYQEAETTLERALRTVETNVTPFRKKSSVGLTILSDTLTSAAMVRQEILRAARMRKIREKDAFSSFKLGLLIDSGEMSRSFDSVVWNELEGTEKELRLMGHEVARIDVSVGASVIPYMQALNPDIVLLLLPHEQCGRYPRHIVAALLEFLGIPFLGSEAISLSRSKDRLLVKKLLEYHEFPTPDWDYVSEVGEYIREDLTFPLIVRSVQREMQEQQLLPKVVKSRPELNELTQTLLTSGVRAILVEEFIQGDVYEVFLFGNKEDLTVLPPLRKHPTDPLSETALSGADTARPAEHLKPATPKKRQVKVQTAQEKHLQILTEMSIDVYRMFSCLDFGQVRILIDSSGNPFVIDVLADPVIGPCSDMSLAASLDGYTYAELLDLILSARLKRVKSRESEVGIQPLTRVLNV